jgi:hypothetical protein
MAEIRASVHDELRARLRTDPELLEEIEGLFLEAAAIEHPGTLVLPSLLTEPWRPNLALHITSHRSTWIGWAIVMAKRRILLPLTRFLFEYAQRNFRRQDRLNLTVLASLERLAAENLRLRRELAARDTRDPHGAGGGPTSA